MIAKRIVEQALAEALKTGGDFAELFAQDKRSGVMLLQDGRVEDAVTGRMHGAGIRIYKGLNSVYVHTNDTSLSGLIAAARKAADAVGTGNECRDEQLVGSVLANRHACRQLPMDVSGTRKAELLRRANLAAKDVSPEIQQVRARLMDSDSEVLIANSEGLYTFDRRVYTRIAIAAIAAGSGENQTGSSSPGALCGYELFDRVDVEEEARRAAKAAVVKLHADFCPAGRMPVVIGNGFGGVIFHEACGHSLEATAVAFGNSEFCGKLGQKIASDKVTAIDDGTMPNEWGSSNVDDHAPGAHRERRAEELHGRPAERPAHGHGAHRQRPPSGLHLRAHLAHAQHLHRPWRRRGRRDHLQLRRRPVRQEHGRRLGQSCDRRVQLRRGGGLSHPGRQN